MYEYKCEFSGRCSNWAKYIEFLYWFFVKCSLLPSSTLIHFVSLRIIITFFCNTLNLWTLELIDGWKVSWVNQPQDNEMKINKTGLGPSSPASSSSCKNATIVIGTRRIYVYCIIPILFMLIHRWQNICDNGGPTATFTVHLANNGEHSTFLFGEKKTFVKAPLLVKEKENKRKQKEIWTKVVLIYCGIRIRWRS